MSKVPEINWSNFEEALGRLGPLCGFLIVLGTTISIYLRETIGLVIGVPDDVEVFGVPLNRQEAFLAVVVIYLVQWVVLKKLFFLHQSIGKPGCEVEQCRALLLGRQNVFNPFSRFDSRLGAAFSGISLVAFVNAVFLFPLIFTAKALASGVEARVLLGVFYLPLLIPVFAKIHSIDAVLVGSRYAWVRTAVAASSIALVVLVTWEIG